MDNEFSIARVYTENGAVCGAGFLVGERLALTCAHVVRFARSLPEDAPSPEGEILLDFPLAPAGTGTTLLRARVVFWDPQKDVAGLELVDEAPPGIRPVLFERLPTPSVDRAGSSRLGGRAFGAFGFPGGYNDGKWTHGVVLDRQGRGWQQLEADKSFGDFVQQGFSGAPVFDAQSGRVLGMIAGVDGEKATRTGYMIPAPALLLGWAELRRVSQLEQARRLLEENKAQDAVALLAQARREFPNDTALAALDRSAVLRRSLVWVIGGMTGLACILAVVFGLIFFSPSQAGRATPTPSLSPTLTATATAIPATATFTPPPTVTPSPTPSATSTATPPSTRTPVPLLVWVRQPFELFEAAEGEARTGLTVSAGSVWHVCDYQPGQTRYPIARSYCHLTSPAGWIAVEAIDFGPTPTPSLTPTATLPPTATPTVTPTPTPAMAQDSKGHTMIRIPAGPFIMGIETGQADERPVHQVTLHSYFIDRFEVTVDQYRRCAAEGFAGCTLPIDPAFSGRYNDPSYNDHPAVGVDWFQAEAYCEWRGGRLPSEAEWEKAARGVDSLYYPWGDQSPTCDMALFGGCYKTPDGRYDTRPVGSYPQDSSPYGVRDLAGSVIEWVYDWYTENAYETFVLSPYPNPIGSIPSDRHSARGYGFSPLGISEPDRLRLTDRNALESIKAYSNVGFRCVIPATEPNLITTP